MKISLKIWTVSITRNPTLDFVVVPIKTEIQHKRHRIWLLFFLKWKWTLGEIRRKKYSKQKIIEILFELKTFYIALGAIMWNLTTELCIFCSQVLYSSCSLPCSPFPLWNKKIPPWKILLYPTDIKFDVLKITAARNRVSSSQAILCKTAVSTHFLRRYFQVSLE